MLAAFGRAVAGDRDGEGARRAGDRDGDAARRGGMWAAAERERARNPRRGRKLVREFSPLADSSGALVSPSAIAILELVVAAKVLGAPW